MCVSVCKCACECAVVREVICIKMRERENEKMFCENDMKHLCKIWFLLLQFYSEFETQHHYLPLPVLLVACFFEGLLLLHVIQHS